MKVMKKAVLALAGATFLMGSLVVDSRAAGRASGGGGGCYYCAPPPPPPPVVHSKSTSANHSSTGP